MIWNMINDNQLFGTSSMLYIFSFCLDFGSSGGRGVNCVVKHIALCTDGEFHSSRSLLNVMIEGILSVTVYLLGLCLFPSYLFCVFFFKNEWTNYLLFIKILHFLFHYWRLLESFFFLHCFCYSLCFFLTILFCLYFRSSCWRHVSLASHNYGPPR